MTSDSGKDITIMVTNGVTVCDTNVLTRTHGIPVLIDKKVPFSEV